MEALRETTDWATPNHIYLLDGTTLVAYIKQGTTEPFYFTKGIKHFDKRGRKFVPADKNLFEQSASSSLIEVQGSKGAVYYVDPEASTCTCPGFTFRGKCKHTDVLVDNLVV
jgi:lysozyme family protein